MATFQQSFETPKTGTEGLVSKVLFVGLVLLASYAFFLVISPFLAGLAWASVLTIAIQPVFRRLRKRFTAGAAAMLTTLITAVTVIVPASFLVIRLAGEFIRIADRVASTDTAKRVEIVQSVQQFWTGVQNRFPSLRSVDPIESLKNNVVDITKHLASAAGVIAQNALTFMALGLFVMLAMFFFLRDGPALVDYFRRLSPLDPTTTDRLFEEIRVLTESSVTATLLIAVLQGIVGGAATGLLGLPAPMIWGVVFGFCSFVPVFGTALAWIPASLWLIALGEKGKAAVMVAVSILIITQVDNVIRPLLVSGRSRLNFQLSMLSVLGGVTAFGMLGLVLGPVIVVVLTALMDVYLDSRLMDPAESRVFEAKSAELRTE